MKKTISILLAFMLTGCAGGWTRDNTSEAEFRRDSYQCEKEAARMYPTVMESSGYGYREPDKTDCISFGNRTDCTTRRGSYTPPPQSDVNTGSRNRAMASCLNAKGYVYKLSR